MTVSVCCYMKLLPLYLFENYINILALEMASSGKRHCVNCIGTLSLAMIHARLSATKQPHCK